jgi:hypothetical protein
MAYPNSETVNFGDLASTTINNYSKTIADNLTNQNALFSALNESGNVDTYDGGLEITEQMDYAANTNVTSYSGLDLLPIQQTQGFTTATFNPANYAVSVVWTGDERRANAGKAQMHNLLKAKIKNAERSLLNRLNQDAYGDGTGNNGKNLTGLAAAVPLANTSGVYGGIDRSAWSFWQNQKFQASVDGGGVATAVTILPMLNRLMTQCSRQADVPDLIICDDATYDLIHAAIQQNQRFVDTKSANAGFAEISWKGVRIRRDSLISGIGASTLFMLNTKFLKLRPREGFEFVDMPEKASINQDAVVRMMTWSGNITCSNSARQGRFSNT